MISANQVESLLEFAEWMLERVAGIWNSASLPNQRRIQEAFFPQGLTVTQDGFGTPLRPYFSSRSTRFQWRKQVWRPQGDSNPRYRRERAMS